jgi:hypothetical protein
MLITHPRVCRLKLTFKHIHISLKYSEVYIQDNKHQNSFKVTRQRIMFEEEDEKTLLMRVVVLSNRKQI